jgi:hypothetical protein
MRKFKLKKHDIVKIVKQKHGHKFSLGQNVEILKVYQYGGYLASDGKNNWSIVDSEAVLLYNKNTITDKFDLFLEQNGHTGNSINRKSLKILIRRFFDEVVVTF